MKNKLSGRYNSKKSLYTINFNNNNSISNTAEDLEY